MGRYRVRGGHAICGRLTVSGAKNEALPVLAAALLTADECVFENVPAIDDTRNFVSLLAELGCDVTTDWPNHVVRVNAANVNQFRLPPALAQRMAASFLVTGPLLARFGRVTAPHPGGCQLGSRPKTVDVKGFQQMGASTTVEAGNYAFRAARLRGAEIFLDYPSHTGTENLLMAACLAEGETVLTNACAEPEIDGLAECLIKMGAQIEGVGTSEIRIVGVERLHGVRHRIKADRLVAGTFALAGAITGGQVEIDDVSVPHMAPLTHKLREVGIGVQADRFAQRYAVEARNGAKLRAVEVQTLHFPGFPTDQQAPFAAFLTQAHGVSVIKERVFNDRLKYADELRKFGAHIDVIGQEAVVHGPTPLTGASVKALDIRSGAALILAALAAAGETNIADSHHVERGYEDIAGALRGLGADIELID